MYQNANMIDDANFEISTLAIPVVTFPYMRRRLSYEKYSNPTVLGELKTF